jgi:hypothetical protein
VTERITELGSYVLGHLRSAAEVAAGRYSVAPFRFLQREEAGLQSRENRRIFS